MKLIPQSKITRIVSSKKIKFHGKNQIVPLKNSKGKQIEKKGQYKTHKQKESISTKIIIFYHNIKSFT